MSNSPHYCVALSVDHAISHVSYKIPERTEVVRSFSIPQKDGIDDVVAVNAAFEREVLALQSEFGFGNPYNDGLVTIALTSFTRNGQQVLDLSKPRVVFTYNPLADFLASIAREELVKAGEPVPAWLK
ncbi:MAG TPA: hypothetical protein PK109_03775 [Candidatus Paceibacterota bacterium]|nr:hypothetical protein [Candidatus Paceibacterota bacterium]